MLFAVSPLQARERPVPPSALGLSGPGRCWPVRATRYSLVRRPRLVRLLPAARAIPSVLCILVVNLLLAGPSYAQAPRQSAGGSTRAALQEARRILFALQEMLSELIAEAEPSVVSVIPVKVLAGHISGPLFAVPQPGVDQLAIPIPPTLPDQSFLDPLNPNYVPTHFGSGVIVDADGLILTNYHVIEGAGRIFVRFQDGTARVAELWSADPRSDLALLHVNAKQLKPIRMGNASNVRKGHIVVALGNPYATARDGRATAGWGIVANVARRPPPMPEFGVTALHQSGTLIQTDIRLNYGTSGGALLNLDGEMVGLITSLAALQAFDQAAGYAIPMDETMLRIVQVLRQGREVEYGFLGIQPTDVTAAAAQRLGLQQPEGAMVNYCFEGTPAYRAGLRPGDVIVGVEGEPVRNRDELILVVGTRFAGSRVMLDVIQDGKRKKIEIKLAKYPIADEVPRPRFRPPPQRGIRVDYSTMLLRYQTNLARLRQLRDGGVLVTEVEPDSPADRAGLLPDTIITHVNGQPVRDPAEFYSAMEVAKGPVKLTTENGLITLQAE